MQKLKIVTYNLRNVYNGVDGVNSFIFRQGLFSKKINEEKPDVICFQEVMPFFREYFEKNFSEYSLYGIGRELNFEGEGVSIAFRKETMDLLWLEQFWLSPTPFKQASKFECQSPHPRSCVEMELKGKNSITPIRLFAVHLDHRNDQARILAVAQIFEKALKDNKNRKYTTIILGDFNAYPDSEAITFCNNYKKGFFVDITKEIPYSFHGFNERLEKSPVKIDYIYIDKSSKNKVKDVRIWDDCEKGIYLSDHYPISCEIKLK